MTFYRYRQCSIILFRTMNIIFDSSKAAQSYEAQAQMLKVLTHPARLAILQILRDGEHCVCHMEAHLGFRQAYISQQLMVLRDAGLVQDRRDGWNVYYRVVEPRIFEVLAAVERILNPEQELSSDDAPASLQSEVTCNCPKCSANEVK
jgi:DNA-binding transcriptional ArsR family regulator